MPRKILQPRLVQNQSEFTLSQMSIKFLHHRVRSAESWRNWLPRIRTRLYCRVAPHEVISKFEKGSIFAFININSITSPFTEVRHFVLSNPNLSVIGILESKLSESSSLQNLNIENYNLIRSDRERQGGGLLLNSSSRYWVTEFQHPIKFPFETESISIKFQSRGISPIILVLIYRPPHVKANAFLQSMALLLPFLNSTGLEAILCGDFNINLLPGHSTTFTWLVNSVSTKKVKNPTHSAITSAGMSLSLIDHFYSNRPKLYIHSDHFSAFGSRHDLVFSVRKKRKEKFPPVRISFRSFGKSTGTHSKMNFLRLVCTICSLTTTRSCQSLTLMPPFNPN